MLTLKDKICVFYRAGKDDTNHACQMLTKANILAQETGRGVAVLMFGEDSNAIEEFIRYGAEDIYSFTCETDITTRTIVDYISGLIPHMRDVLILFAANKSGKEVSAFLSTRHEIGLTADCINIRNDKTNGYVFSRAAIGDSVIADIVCDINNVYICTVKKGAFEKVLNEKKSKSSIERIELHNTSSASSITAFECVGKRSFQDEDITNYDIVFGIGRGVKDEALRLKIFEIAQRFNAVVVGTKPTIDEKWLPYSHQVGQSGKSIAPKLYIALGISGASQHLVGIVNAKKVIAVNSDEKAMIFQYADYYIVDRIENIIDELEKIIESQKEVFN